MADAALLNQIRPGMKVRTSDGKTLGTVRQVHWREAESYVEVTPRGALWKPWQVMGKVQRVFLPGSTVTELAGQHVRVALDSKTARGCTWHPSWIPPENYQRRF